MNPHFCKLDADGQLGDYPGFSLLFDNPGEHCLIPLERDSHFIKIHCDFADPAIALYEGLRNGVDGILPQLEPYGFARLPPSSFHVTIWDGINPDSMLKIPEAIRVKHRMEEFLNGLPNCLLETHTFIDDANASELVSRSFQLTFEFERLQISSTSRALMAKLKTADAESEAEHERIKDRRNKLYDRFGPRYGLEKPRYSPHVSLGYFLDSESAADAKTKKATWTEAVARRVPPCTVCFSSVRLYAFTNMATYFTVLSD